MDQSVRAELKVERPAGGQGQGLHVVWRVDSKGTEKVRWEAATVVHVGDGGDLGQGGHRGGEKWVHLRDTWWHSQALGWTGCRCSEGKEDSRMIFSLCPKLFKLWKKTGNLGERAASFGRDRIKVILGILKYKFVSHLHKYDIAVCQTG